MGYLAEPWLDPGTITRSFAIGCGPLILCGGLLLRRKLTAVLSARWARFPLIVVVTTGGVTSANGEGVADRPWTTISDRATVSRSESQRTSTGASMAAHAAVQSGCWARWWKAGARPYWRSPSVPTISPETWPRAASSARICAGVFPFGRYGSVDTGLRLLSQSLRRGNRLHRRPLGEALAKLNE